MVNVFNSSYFQFCHDTSTTSDIFGPYVPPDKNKNVISYFKEREYDHDRIIFVVAPEENSGYLDQHVLSF